MEYDIIKTVKDAFLKRADELTTWVGVIGAALIALGLYSVAFWGCVALVFLPDAKFSEVFAKWTKKLRDMN